MCSPLSPPTLLVLFAAILLLLSSLSAPILHPIYFLSASLQVTLASVPLSGSVKLGVFGYCVQFSSQQACSRVGVGYDLDPGSLISLPSNTDFGFSTSLIRQLTYLLILHPIAAGLALLSALSGLFSHHSRFALSRLPSFLASIAAFVALIAVVFDFVAFSVAKSRIRSAQTSSATTTAYLGNAIWLALAGAICLILSGFLFCSSRCLVRKRRRSQIAAATLRPNNDSLFASQMRQDAIDAEKDRQATLSPDQHHQSIPAFAPYTSATLEERIPLAVVDPSSDDEQRLAHRASLTTNPSAHYPDYSRPPSSRRSTFLAPHSSLSAYSFSTSQPPSPPPRSDRPLSIFDMYSNPAAHTTLPTGTMNGPLSTPRANPSALPYAPPLTLTPSIPGDDYPFTSYHIPGIPIQDGHFLSPTRAFSEDRSHMDAMSSYPHTPIGNPSVQPTAPYRESLDFYRSRNGRMRLPLPSHQSYLQTPAGPRAPLPMQHEGQIAPNLHALTTPSDPFQSQPFLGFKNAEPLGPQGVGHVVNSPLTPTYGSAGQ